MSRETSVTVDRDFARIGSKSYAINKINSVDVRSTRPNGSGPIAGAAILCFVMAMVALGSSGTFRAIAFAIAAVLAFLGYLAWKQSKIVEYQLFLTTSSQEVAALKSHDGPFVFRLREQIEAAMAAH